MKALIMIGSLAAVGYFVWHYRDLADGKNAAESRLLDLVKEDEAVRRDLEAANLRLYQLSTESKQNWVDERNRNR
jgi:hypothetical protein